MKQRTVAIELKIPDNTAFTTFLALRRLGIAISGVRRSEIWRMEDTGNSNTFLDRVKANQTIFNPNKHRLVDLPASNPRIGEAWIARTGDANEVREHLGGKGIADIVAAQRYVGWRLIGTDGAPARRDVLHAAVEGLLCNPAIEKATYY